MSTPTPVESAPVHFPQVRVSNKEGVCVQLLVEDGEGASSFSRGESFLCCFCDDGGHSCSDGDGSRAEAESNSFA